MVRPYLADPDFTLWHGDVREVLPTLPADSVDCALTSPPFYALRDYSVQGQIGLEATPDEWVAELVAVFRELRRVLKPAGTLWVEIGSSYASNESGGMTGSTLSKGGQQTPHNRIGRRRATAYKPKDLIMQPFLLAEALRRDGWYLRQIIIWEKKNAMPESVRDRCTTSHSYILLLAKSRSYFFDSDAISEEITSELSIARNRSTPRQIARAGAFQPNTDERPPIRTHRQITEVGRNARSVWTIPTQGYPDAHFATWPEALVERIVKAGCPEQVCGTCGKARERIVERAGEGTSDGRRRPTPPDGQAHRNADPRSPQVRLRGALTVQFQTIGWSDCGHNNYRPGVVLDPFGGSGTTALVARRLGRRSVLVELNESYCAMAARRLQQLSLLAEPA